MGKETTPGWLSSPLDRDGDPGTRNFAGLLDAVEHGGDVVIMRDGVTVGQFVPERRSTADRLKEALRDHAPDPGFADAVEAARADLRASFSDEVRTRPDA